MMSENSSLDRYQKEEGKGKAIKRLGYAAVCFVLYLILYYVGTGGTGRYPSLLCGGVSAFLSLGMLIFFIAGIYGLIRYR